ncbi:MAG TPA: hypothetical protein VK745_13220, partial [Polyangiaceae bacterium]|nr:hypothetical protein [Polyangiaceae bacterium]
DGDLSLASANEALRAANCSETVPALEARVSEKPLRASDPAVPPESGVKPSTQASALGLLARFRSALKP